MLPWARIATLAAFLAIGAIVIFAAVDRERSGTPLATLALDGSTSNAQYVVKGAPPGSRLRVGDHVALGDPGTAAAFQLHALAIGSTLPLRRTAPLPEVTIAEPVVASSGPRLGIVLVLIQAMFVGIAAIVAARGRSSGSPQLAWLLALIVLLFNPTSPAWPTWLTLVYALLGGSIAVIAFACAADFASRFTGDGRAAWSRRYRRVSYAAAVVGSAINLGVSYDSFFRPTTPGWVVASAYVALAAQALVLLVGLTLAYLKASSAERQKALWVVAGLGLGTVGFVSAVFAGSAGVKEPARDIPLLLMIAMPVGCAYAILRYRLLDIAFVVNRATVFGITSLVVLAALALVDFGLQNLLGSWLQRTGAYVQLGLALAIGIATRPLHGRVDAFVDDLFFRRRHEAERRLRQFVRDVAHISDSDVVLERTANTVASAVELRCTIFLLDCEDYAVVKESAEASEPRRLDRNDGAVVRLLAAREPVDLHDVQTALTGDFAFPMFARDRLLGILVCANKLAGAAVYAPDELEAIDAVAHACGLTLDLLRIEALERELQALRSALPLAATGRYVQ